MDWALESARWNTTYSVASMRNISTVLLSTGSLCVDVLDSLTKVWAENKLDLRQSERETASLRAMKEPSMVRSRGVK